jgi:hypothetical protein
MDEFELRLYLRNHLKLKTKEICPLSDKPYTKVQLLLDNDVISSISLPII